MIRRGYSIRFSIFILTTSHEINQFCSKHTLEEVYISKFDLLDENLIQAIQNSCNQWAPGIEIISIRVTKPRIPKHIVNSYEQMEKEKTMQKIALETQKVTEVTAETRRIEANINAQMEADVSNIKVAKELNQTKSQIEKENVLSNRL